MKGRSTIAAGDIAATFAATPPLEGVRMLLSMAISGQTGVPERQQRVLGSYDISRAHFHSPVRAQGRLHSLGGPCNAEVVPGRHEQEDDHEAIGDSRARPSCRRCAGDS
eukprot:11519314-Heterocapsa_arctica.AAC.1